MREGLLIFLLCLAFGVPREAVSAKANRVAVVVLSYEDRWLSYEGEKVAATYFKRELSRRYRKVFFAMGRNLDQDLVRSKLRQALATGGIVDLFFSAHSGPEGVLLAPDGEYASAVEMIRPVVEEEPEAAAKRLGIVFNFGCNNTEERDGFGELGFRSFAGHKGTSAGAVAFKTFLKPWLECQDLSRSVAWTDKTLRASFKRNAMLKALFPRFSPKDPVYNARFLAWGEEANLCKKPEKHLN